MHFRDGTDDQTIWQQVYEDNEYNLPDNMQHWVVLDIGAHIGAFSAACLKRGVMHVTAYEPCASTIEYFNKNVQDRKVTLLQAAVDAYNGSAELSHYPWGPSGNSLHFHCDVTERVPVLAFSDIVLKQPYWDLVKLDCEWSEYPILSQTPDERLARGVRYLIESHLPWRHQEVEDRMAKLGYKKMWVKEKGKIRLYSYVY